jgi:hypothetical protein
MGIRSNPWVALYFNLARSGWNDLVHQIDFQVGPKTRANHQI